MTIELSLEPAASPAACLRGLCGGNLHLPGDPGYDAARLPWNVAVDQRPAAVAFPRTAAEVGSARVCGRTLTRQRVLLRTRPRRSTAGRDRAGRSEVVNTAHLFREV